MAEKLAEMNSHLDELVQANQRSDCRQKSQGGTTISNWSRSIRSCNDSPCDPLTGLWNRRKYNESIVPEWLRCLTHRKPVSLLFIDVDYFKNYNDLYGHVAGDECLIKIGETIKASLTRPSDMAVRYGGEEFVVLLTETGKKMPRKSLNCC